MQSIVQQRGGVTFPEFTGERVYMQKFFKKEGLPKYMERWQSTVDAMLDGIDTDKPIYIMVDQGEVRKGLSHRRPGVHIDGYWCEHLMGHRGHVGSWDIGEGRWNQCDFSTPEALILASDYSSAKAYMGEFEGECGEGGDFSHLDLSGLKCVNMEAGIVYAGNVTMLHESLPVYKDVKRTLVRLNVPGWSPH